MRNAKHCGQWRDDCGAGSWHLLCSEASWERSMDLVFVVGTIVFFAISLAYASGCDHL
ncbi:MAG TPA: hypothetical protein VMK12_18405 [Anaeromyxobacteraceae bacterium]|nr:hypothetical protein [Anaeromyxobacteraceae bacterium]